MITRIYILGELKGIANFMQLAEENKASK